MPSIPALAGRAFQLLSAAVVLGLSANLYQQTDYFRRVCELNDAKCGFGGLLPSVGYSAFVGAWGLLDAFVGIAGVFLEAIPWIVVAGIDGLASVFYLAGGIRMAILLGSARCSSEYGYCTKLKADNAFLFLGFLATLALVALGFFSRRRSGGGVSAV